MLTNRADLEDVLALAKVFYHEDGFTTSEQRLRCNLQILLGSETARVAVVTSDERPLGFAITTTSFG
jgi:hypothetical protein